jgi:caa(3)-type oxidase subunit IV
MSDEHGNDHAGPNFQAYMMIFYILCVCTALSFVSNFFVDHLMGQRHLSAGIIMVIAVFKATLVASIFMHLKWDFSKVYCIIVPVCIVTLMMVIILSIDQTLAWHALPESGVPLYPSK